MDQLKETKTDKQQAPASTSASSNSASCSSSSSAASSPSEAQHDQDGLNDISLSTTHPLSTDPLANDNTATAPPTDVLSMETRAEEDTTADGAAMDIDQQQSAESHTTAVNGADSGSTGASTDPARMTDDLASSLSSASLTSLSVSSSSTASPDTAAPSTSTVTAPSANTPAAADTTPAAAASASSSSADTATTTPADSELATFSLDVDEQRIQDCLRLMHTDIKRGEASVRAILKMLQNLQKAPTKPDNRRMRKDNIVVKKHIVEVSGALALLELVGYRTVELKGHPYLAIDDAAGFNSDMLEKAIKLLLQYQQRQVEEDNRPASVTSGVRVRCAGGCGYWGDSNQENLCSICHKTKHLGASATQAMTGISSTEPKRCIKQCGLFGSDKYAGMCSQCFSKQQATAAVKKSSKQRWLAVRRQLHAVYLFSLGKQEEQANKGRCFVCAKRLPVPIECRCRRTFCSAHRFPLDHQCSYDAQSEHKRKLRRQLIHVQTSKMDRI